MQLWLKFLILSGLIFFLSINSKWFLIILKFDRLTAILLFIFSVFLLVFLTGLINRYKFFIFSIMVIFSIYFSIKHIENDFLKPNALENYIMSVRKTYYPFKIGSIIHNKYTLFAYKYQRNFFTNLNFNQFFFGGQPRFRSYAIDFEKFPHIEIIFFLLGIYYLFKSKTNILKPFCIYSLLILLILSFADPGFELGIYPIYPVIVSLIGFGVFKLLENIPKSKLFKK